MRKFTSILLALLLVVSLPATVFAVETADSVRAMIEELPAVEEFKAMDTDSQLAAYNQTQSAYDAYMALPEEERAQIEGAEAAFEALFSHFNTLIAPAGEAAAVETAAVTAEEEAGNDPLSGAIATALSVVLAVFLLGKLKKKTL